MATVCAIIPVYNHHDKLAGIVDALRQMQLSVYIVDDGSCAQTASIIDDLAEPDVSILRHKNNLGKGAAMKTGFRAALKSSYSHALQIDADGQHNIADVQKFVQLALDNDGALINGCPNFDASVPRARYLGRYLTHVWVWINTLSLSIPDSMCGFRVYPLVPTNEIIEQERIGDRMDFDIEFIVRWAWHNYPIVHLRTDVVYPANSQSNFRLLDDNILITLMHTRLFFGMLLRIPRLLSQRWRATGVDA